MRFFTLNRWYTIAIASLFLILSIAGSTVCMPGRSYNKPTPEISENDSIVYTNIRTHVYSLAHEIGERNHQSTPLLLKRAAHYIEGVFQQIGYSVRSQNYECNSGSVRNLEVIISPVTESKSTYIIGAHYDSAQGAPGADDNASGVAVLLELARIFKDKKIKHSLRFVAFTNEEPPWFQTEKMGSWVYAEQLKKENIQVSGMFSLESIGVYSSQPNSQKYPLGVSSFYPNQGNFIAFVSNLSSRSFARTSIELFRQYGQIPSEGIVAPEFIPGIGWSDQWSFWKFNYPGVMITDTAIFRNPYYHTSNDQVDTLDYVRMTTITIALSKVIEHIVHSLER